VKNFALPLILTAIATSLWAAPPQDGGSPAGQSAVPLASISREASRSASNGPEDPTINSRAKQLFSEIAPKFAELTDTVLYADIWERQGLSKRDRSLITVSALIAMNRPDQLRSHIALARQNGLTTEELSEAITHLAFYAGWPSSVTAATIAKDVLVPK
jgi:4-carboxymuconolactone decarboxylase